MDERTEQQLTDYLDTLLWLETASVAEIEGALSTASATVREDLELGIQCMMDSDRPGLANYFPNLVSRPTSLSVIRQNSQLSHWLWISLRTRCAGDKRILPIR
ncbi:hypothetical protein KI429_00620 (plasmid) [Pseudomonas shirazica]|nr:hypothetical protein KI429_00620 [Pseudomonas shirazica]